MRYSEEDIDIMLFDYLEGNLPDNELELVNLQIAEDPIIREELSLWKSSYVQADFYNTSALESTLVRRSVPAFNFNFHLNSILIICIAVFTGTKINTHGLELNTNQMQILTIESIPPEIQIQSVEKVTTSKKIPPIETTGVVLEYEKSVQGEIAISVPEPIWPNFAPVINELQINPIENIAMDSRQMSPFLVKDVKKMDRKSKRAKQKMQRKAVQNQKASEFLKGNVPYVVPVDTQNF